MQHQASAPEAQAAASGLRASPSVAPATAPDMRQRIDEIIARYDRDPNHALAAMQDMQDAFNYVPREGLEALSRYFARPVGQLYALTTFYKALSLEPKGRHIVKICAGTTCHIRGGENIGAGVTRELGIKPGETSADGEVSFEEVHCVGACALAPVVIVDDELHGHVTLEQLPEILACCHAGSAVAS